MSNRRSLANAAEMNRVIGSSMGFRGVPKLAHVAADYPLSLVMCDERSGWTWFLPKNAQLPVWIAVSMAALTTLFEAVRKRGAGR